MPASSSEPSPPVFRFELFPVHGGWLLQPANGAARHFHHTHGALSAALIEADGARCIMIVHSGGSVRVFHDSERDSLHHRDE